MCIRDRNYCRGDQRFVGHVSDVEAMIDELISNAIKHGVPGLLEVSSEYEAADDHGEEPRIVFSVTDSGPGIEDVAPLLDAEFRDHSNSQARGMGYSLIKRLADRTGATLDIESSAGEPTAVRFRLPASPH